MFLSNICQRLENRHHVSLCLFAIVCLQCQSQTTAPVSYFSALTPVATSPGSYSVDSSGNIYVISPDGASVLKENRGNWGTYLQSTVSSGTPGDLLAVDGGGDVFRLSGGTLYEEVNEINGPTYQDTPYTEKVIYNITDVITSMAVDMKSNVYLLDATQNELLRLTPTSSGYVQSFVATGLSGAKSIGLDASGNVYVLEAYGTATTYGMVEKYTDIGTGYQGGEFTSSLDIEVWQIAVDASGDVYLWLSGGPTQITEIQTGTGKQIAIPCPPSGCSVDTGFGYGAAAFLAGPDGNLYAPDSRGNIYKQNFGSPNLGTIDVGSAGTTYLAFQRASATAFAFSATVDLSAFADYGAGDSLGINACLNSSQTVTSIEISPFCYIAVNFTPPGLGVYQGELKLTNPQYSPITVAAQGTGAAPQIGFSPAPQSIILSSAAPYNLQGPEGIAVDGKGNLYIADTGGKQVLKETLSSGEYTQAVIANAQSGLRNPVGVAVDANGNVYVADSMVGIVKETLTPSGYTQSTAITNGGPVGVAVDASGTLYFVNGTSVIKAVPNGGQYTQTTLLSSLTAGNAAISTQGIAVDSNGNLYVTDTGNQRVIKFSSANGSYTQSTVANGFGFPWGVAVDFAGNVYVGDEAGGVFKESLSNGTYSQTLMNGSIETAYGVAVDGSENVYAATSQPAYIYEIPAAQATTLSFASTPVGTTSPDSPQTLTVQNTGMYPITFTIPGSGTNPSISAGFTIGAANGTAGTCPDLFASSTGVELSPGGSCTYQISFSPTTAGAISGSLTFTDNSDNVAGATQTITLLGTATAAALAVQISPTSVTFTSQSTGTTSAAQVVTLTNSGNAALSIASIAASGDFAETQDCGSSVATGANCTISVTFTPTAVGTHAGSLTITDDAASSPQTVSLTGTGVAPAPTASVTPTSLTFAAQNTGSTSAAQIVTLTNSGNAALLITSIAASGDFAETQNCGSSVAAGSNCAISVTFMPTATGTRTGTLTVTDNASNSPQTVSLSGTGTAPVTPTPAVTLSPTSLSFAAEADGSTSAAQTVTLTNSGTAALSIASISASGNFGETNTCGNNVATGANCTISVTFTPTSGGSLNGVITITDNAANSPQTVALSGTGSTVTITPPSTGLTVSSAGGSTTASIQLASAGGFSGNVNLTCSVAWQGTGTASDAPTCSLNPTQEQVTSGGSATTTLTINTTASSTAQMNNQWLHGGAGVLAALLLFGIAPRKRRKQLGFMIVLACIAVGACSGCGKGNGSGSSSSGGPNPNPGTTTGNYVVTVSATSGTVTTSTQLSLSVQ